LHAKQFSGWGARCSGRMDTKLPNKGNAQYPSV
jgi:hypothetical protein